ncbi:MAG: hypothetical protein Ct9H300mP31_12530 [Acidimicrobiaceae bacterium]|nr:MAG: hypothetical protein Ct9H300mP31_12530 [Acidimicrobiaceae bacterium]
MARLRQVRRDDLHPGAEPIFQLLFGDRDPVDEPGTPTGTPGDWWTTFALVPDVFDHAVAGFALYRSSRRLLDPKLRELGQTRVGWCVGSRFVYSQHCKSCRTVGIPDEKIAAIESWETADCFDDAERAVLAFTDALSIQHGRVPDGVFDALRDHLSDEEILELAYIVGTLRNARGAQPSLTPRVRRRTTGPC